MSPILQGIQALSRGSYRSLDEYGELAEINAGLNQAGAYLMQKDNARAEWIRGVSHDIRTPLSMVLGYASELEDDDALPTEARRQAGMIRRQGERLKSLVEESEPDHQTGVRPPAHLPGDGGFGGDRPAGGKRGAQQRPTGAV